MSIKKNKKLKILIAEDDHDSILFFEIMSLKISREVIVAFNGAEAVLVCQNNPDIDLVLMDFLMPVMNGYEATKKIREFNEELVIIVQTAYAQNKDREKAFAVGCTDYLTKPISRKLLNKLIIKYFPE